MALRDRSATAIGCMTWSRGRERRASSDQAIRRTWLPIGGEVIETTARGESSLLQR